MNFFTVNKIIYVFKLTGGDKEIVFKKMK